MKIVLCCAGGFSTTMLMDAMKRIVRDSSKLQESDFEFKAIPIDLLDAEIDDTDVLVLGPQIAHKIDAIEPLIKPHRIPYVIVDQDTYGRMDGALVMKMVLVAHKKAAAADRSN